MRTHFACLLALSCAVLAGCANPGTQYRPDVYAPNQLNRPQSVSTVEIISINPARIALNNDDARSDAQLAGAVLGAIAGAAVGNHNHHDSSSRVLGGVAGGALGGLAGSAVPRQTFQEGVQVVYRTSSGQVRQSTQLGRACEYRIGPAVMAGAGGETRVQPNNPYGCGR